MDAASPEVVQQVHTGLDCASLHIELDRHNLLLRHMRHRKAPVCEHVYEDVCRDGGSREEHVVSFQICMAC